MSVNLTLASLSQTAALNGPDGAVDAPSTLDDAIRYHGAFIAELRDRPPVVSFANVSGIPITANTTLTVAQAGSWADIQAASVTVTLPALAGTTIGGTTFTIRASSFSSTIKGSGAELISSSLGVTGNTLSILAGETITLVANSTAWIVVMNGFGAPSFPSSKATNGYHRAPSGVITQWGALTTAADGNGSITFPIAFPALTGAVVANVYDNSATTHGLNITSTSLTGFTVNSNTGGVGLARTVKWIAIGY